MTIIQMLCYYAVFQWAAVATVVWTSTPRSRVDYTLIKQLEHEMFPEWFQGEWPNGLPAFIDNSPGAVIPVPAGTDVHWLGLGHKGDPFYVTTGERMVYDPDPAARW